MAGILSTAVRRDVWDRILMALTGSQDDGNGRTGPLEGCSRFPRTLQSQKFEEIHSLSHFVTTL
jgi:hypothetical protein